MHIIHTKQIIKTDMPTLWEFISSPKNLSKITPKQMDFKIISPEDLIRDIYNGQIIEYNVTPILGLKLNWVTEIKNVEPGFSFTDEQRFGPYKFWHHKHSIKAVEGGIEMTDIVHYKLPFGPLGKIANSLFVKNKLKQIFDYRFNEIEKLFNHGN